MKPRAILLDLDDTILSYSAGADELWQELVVAYAPRAGVRAARFTDALDASRTWFWSDLERETKGRLDMWGSRRAIVGHAFEALGIRDEATARDMADTYTSSREARLETFPGALEKLAEWRDAGIALGLCTNGHPSFQRPKIERFDLEAFFGVIQVEGELGYGKPDPRVFRGALARLGIRPDEAWMVGDNLHADVAGAQAVGLHGIWVDHRQTGLPEGAPARPDRIVTAIAELEVPA